MDKQEYIDLKLKLDAYEQELKKKYVAPLTCICCRTTQVKPYSFGRDGLLDHDVVKQEDGCWDGGAVARLSPGFGSRFDLSSYYIAVCDDCLRQLVEQGAAPSTKEIDHAYFNETRGIMQEYYLRLSDPERFKDSQ